MSSAHAEAAPSRIASTRTRRSSSRRLNEPIGRSPVVSWMRRGWLSSVRASCLDQSDEARGGVTRAVVVASSGSPTTHAMLRRPIYYYVYGFRLCGGIPKIPQVSCLHVNGLFYSSLGFPAPCALAHAPPPCPRGWQARIRRPSLFGREGSHEAPGRAPHRHALEDLLQLLPVRAARRAARNANVSRGGFGAGRARGCVCRSAQPRRCRVRGGPHTRPDCSRAETQRPPASSGPRRARRRRSRPVREEGRAAGGGAEA